MNVNEQQVQAFLAAHLGAPAPTVTLVGAGAWSRCFAFRWRHQDLVIRFGSHVDDFRKDARAHTYATPRLPVPAVLEIGPAPGGYYAISTRAHGAPLEQLSADPWRLVVPALASALEAMRTADLSATSGLGGWGPGGDAPHRSWRDFLLAVADDPPQRRTHGWRRQLAAWPQVAEAFAWGYARLQQVALDAVPRCLVHADLLNRNVLAADGRLAGVLDWGCSLYGDHLYDLAWFEFWAPWHPALDVPYLAATLAQRWRAAGYAPPGAADRRLACILHIGLDHLAYNAHLGHRSAALATAARLRALVTEP